MTHQTTRPAEVAIIAGHLKLPTVSQDVPEMMPLAEDDRQLLATGIRSSKVVGSIVVNGAFETLGTVHDLIISAVHDIHFAVLSVGGVLGIGEKFVAVPYGALEVHDKLMVFRDNAEASLMSVPDLPFPPGERVSEVVGGTVVNGANETVGTVDDLIVTVNHTVRFAVLSVGGFLGIDTKHVVVPYGALEVHDKRILLRKASKEALEDLPEFTYSN